MNRRAAIAENSSLTIKVFLGIYNTTSIGTPLYKNREGYQYWSLNVDPVNTSLYINLIDNINESTLFFGTPNDQVSGYTLSFIEENILKHSYGLSSLSTELKNHKPSGVTDLQIDNLLSNY